MKKNIVGFLAAMGLLVAATKLDAALALRLQYLTYNSSSSTNSPSFQIKVFNDSLSSIALSRIEVRYWFTEEGTQSQTVNVDWSGRAPSGTDITNQTRRSIKSTPLGEQTHYLKFTFNSGAGSFSGGESFQVNARYNKNDWSTYTQTNDYSFTNFSVFQDWSKLTAYLDGVLVWGIEPGASREAPPNGVFFSRKGKQMI